MPGHSDSHPGTDERRQAITVFLGAGMHEAPAPALAVQVLADARRSVAVCLARNESIATWLAGEIRFFGIKENAATLVALELPEHRNATAQSYASRHPDRVAILQKLLVALQG
ncbi:MAG TPA: hypothetical protein VF070_47625 [Streptosporangiaceae bacterium]